MSTAACDIRPPAVAMSLRRRRRVAPLTPKRKLRVILISMDNPKTLKKEELEQIAKELKKKLSRALIAAKQKASSPLAARITKSSPLKEHVNKAHFDTPTKVLSLSPLYSPANKLPTHLRLSAASLLSSSPLESPVRRSRPPGGGVPTMVLTERLTEREPAEGRLRPSPPLNRLAPLAGSLAPLAGLLGLLAGPLAPKEQTTPTMQKRQLVMRTPTQPQAAKDDEGADLLMYLATLPSPAKANFPPTPNLGGSSTNKFIAPPPPLTPKRHLNMASKTPQRATPLVNLFNQTSNLPLPSSGLALTPAGFNMNDYVNFFSPSPGGINLSRNFMKTPDFAAMQNSNHKVDGKMINFDRVGLNDSSER